MKTRILKNLLLGTLLSICLLPQEEIEAQITDISYEIVESFPQVLAPDDPFYAVAGHITADVFIHLTHPADFLHYVEAFQDGTDNVTPFYISAPLGCFTGIQTNHMGGIPSAAQVEANPAAQYYTSWLLGEAEDVFVFTMPAGPIPFPSCYSAVSMCHNYAYNGMVSSNNAPLNCNESLSSCVALCGDDSICMEMCMNEFVNCQNSLPDLVQAAGEDLKIRVARVTTRGDFSLFACFNILIEGDEDNMVQQCMSIDVPLTDYWSSTGTCGPGTHWDPELSLCIPDEICLWNPDSDGDLFVGTPDLLAFLGAFGLSDPDMDGIWE